ncbi:hypothetical protein QR680_014970 [Steinernema hermaphroditum]|uniref:Uncharacterized protein n=1 Tax=Steinernema hermaphroditum TaxID=289476 RepID=A0AA39IAN3_9BILA|nr:hypothetical protein QR680_014970 [Steinernema hermaphroditum]
MATDYLIHFRDNIPERPFEWTDLHTVSIPSEGSFDYSQTYVCDRETDTTVQTEDVGTLAGNVDVRDVACQYEAQALSNDTIQRICSQPKFKAFVAKAGETLLVELEKEALLSQFR